MSPKLSCYRPHSNDHFLASVDRRSSFKIHLWALSKDDDAIPQISRILCGMITGCNKMICHTWYRSGIGQAQVLRGTRNYSRPHWQEWLSPLHQPTAIYSPLMSLSRLFHNSILRVILGCGISAQGSSSPRSPGTDIAWAIPGLENVARASSRS